MKSNYKKIIHISDTHIFAHRKKNMRQLEETCQIIARNYDPDNWILLITGDTVDGAGLKRA